MKEDLSLEDFKVMFQSIWKKKYIIVLMVIWGMLFGGILGMLQGNTSEHTATTSVYMSSYSVDEAQLAETMISVLSNYADMATSTKVCERAAAMIGSADITADDIKGMITTELDTTSYVFYIRAVDTDAQKAISVSNKVAEAFLVELENITGTSLIQILDRASEENIESSNKLVSNIIKFGVIFGILYVAYLAVSVLFSSKLLSVNQWDGEIVGIIPYDED